MMHGQANIKFLNVKFYALKIKMQSKMYLDNFENYACIFQYSISQF